tara:strand:- start:79872 stop:81377 length:1506 start_codon:yes stop_codon:yes gene_type:complete
MPNLLTQDEYLALASTLRRPTEAHIDGALTVAASGKTFDSVNPATGEVLASIAACDKADVDRAVGAAREAFADGRWSKMHPTDRKTILLRFCELITANQHELAVLESLDSGKPIFDIETIDLPESIHCIQWHAETADKIYDQVAPSGSDAVGLVVREPVGVVGCVLPWNFPILMVAWKLGPALAAGNSVIVKPAEETSMTAIRLAELALEAGVPKGVFSVVTGLGETVGRAIGLHPGIDMVSFTGSTEVGRLFLKYSADSNLKKIVLECGGKNPCIVMDDAEDLEAVADHATNAVFWNMGENCSSNSRLIVHEKVKAQLVEKIIACVAKTWPTGRPLDPSNRLGAIVSKAQYERILGYIEIGKKEGATLVCGGNALEIDGGYYVEPTIFDNVTADMTIAREEIFGPVLAVLEIASVDEAVALANDTNYGLAASLFTANVKTAHRMARAIQAGTVTVNCYGEGDMSTPFGGFKESGFGGRDNSIHAHDQYTELKTIWLDLSN